MNPLQRFYNWWASEKAARPGQILVALLPIIYIIINIIRFGLSRLVGA